MDRRGLDPAVLHPGYFLPTLAIELAPPAVGGLAWLAFGGSMTGTDILGGYAVLMALVQVRLIPKYARLRFGSSFWAFTFAYAAAASFALHWLNLKRPAGYQAYRGDCPRAHHRLYRDHRGPVADPARPGAVPAAPAPVGERG